MQAEDVTTGCPALAESVCAAGACPGGCDESGCGAGSGDRVLSSHMCRCGCLKGQSSAHHPFIRVPHTGEERSEVWPICYK